jgi:hypothetical protein
LTQLTADQKLAIIRRHCPTFSLVPYERGNEYGWRSTCIVDGKPLELSEVSRTRRDMATIRNHIIASCFTDTRIVPKEARASA